MFGRGRSTMNQWPIKSLKKKKKRKEKKRKRDASTRKEIKRKLNMRLVTDKRGNIEKTHALRLKTCKKRKKKEILIV